MNWDKDDTINHWDVLATNVDTLWIMGSVLSFPCRSSWNGFMSTVKTNKLTVDSNIIPLPFVNMDPGNLNTIYTALLFAAEKCKHYKKPCIVTFDQPLFQKAVDIVTASNESNIVSSVIVRLGGFHTLMSFMGSVGNIMAGSGLEQLWSTVYAQNTVPHLMSGHAYSRALRAHFLVYEALSVIILRELSLPEESITILENLYKNPMLHELENNILLEQIQAEIEDKFEAHSKLSRTGKLWVNYLKLVSLMKLFIVAERSGIWSLHVYCVKHMIPIFYATGHINYAKCAHLYVIQMQKLESLDSSEYENFVTKGLFTIRRTNKFFSGTWTDMIIEQSLMRAMKTQGGLTQGRGLIDSSLARWISSMSSCIPVCNALEDFTGIRSSSSNQHVELSKSRLQRDKTDFGKFITWLEDHNPFKCTEFMSLSSGIIACSSVNCDQACDIGANILNKNIGKKFTEIKCKRSENIKNFAQMSNKIKICQKYVDINPMQLFNRIICSSKTPEEIKHCFNFELSPYPLALFKDGNLRRGVKSQLLKEIDSLHAPSDHLINNETFYVIDGGFLLHKVKWQRPATYHEIFLQYVNYIVHTYKKSSVVVFDGYNLENISTKDNLQKFRAKENVAVSVQLHATVVTPQDLFLRNSQNKKNFIEILQRYLEENGITVYQAERDADVLIALTAVRFSSVKTHVTVVSEDTDIMVLLIYHIKENNVCLLRPGKGAKGDKISKINEIQTKLGHTKEHILFIHAMSGCDTTSFLYNKSKKCFLKSLQENEDLCRDLNVFQELNADIAVLIKSGLKVLLNLYRCPKKIHNINQLRHTLYIRMTSRQSLNSELCLASLPPTEESAKQHILRTYFQVIFLKYKVHFLLCIRFIFF